MHINWLCHTRTGWKSVSAVKSISDIKDPLLIVDVVIKLWGNNMNSWYFRELLDNPSFDTQHSNGYIRREYQDFGFTDFEIEYKGLDLELHQRRLTNMMIGLPWVTKLTPNVDKYSVVRRQIPFRLNFFQSLRLWIGCNLEHYDESS